MGKIDCPNGHKISLIESPNKHQSIVITDAAYYALLDEIGHEWAEVLCETRMIKCDCGMIAVENDDGAYIWYVPV